MKKSTVFMILAVGFMVLGIISSQITLSPYFTIALFLISAVFYVIYVIMFYAGKHKAKNKYPKICKTCNQINDPEASFCTNCGSGLPL